MSGATHFPVLETSDGVRIEKKGRWLKLVTKGRKPVKWTVPTEDVDTCLMASLTARGECLPAVLADRLEDLYANVETVRELARRLRLCRQVLPVRRPNPFLSLDGKPDWERIESDLTLTSCKDNGYVDEQEVREAMTQLQEEYRQTGKLKWIGLE